MREQTIGEKIALQGESEKWGPGRYAHEIDLAIRDATALLREILPHVIAMPDLYPEELVERIETVLGDKDE